jgi:hypothetical protein
MRVKGLSIPQILKEAFVNGFKMNLLNCININLVAQPIAETDIVTGIHTAEDLYYNSNV